jgi:hypothetical protein
MTIINVRFSIANSIKNKSVDCETIFYVFFFSKRGSGGEKLQSNEMMRGKLAITSEFNTKG